MNTEDWTIVSQVKSFRVVYFTDDPDYAPPSEGDWYYASPYRGALPAGMTLRNCWRWRFDGHAFTDAGTPAALRGPALLLQQNKEALRTLLRDKIDAVRRPHAPECLMGERLRAAKLDEARRAQAGTMAAPDTLGHLADAAAAHGCTLREMAQRVLALHEAEVLMLRQTEHLRESFCVAIDAAGTQAELIALRARLIDEIAPEINDLLAVQPPHTTPHEQRAAPSRDALAAEQLRLRTQLRLRINTLRRPYVSLYLLDEVVLKHRGRIAQAVLAAGGAVPPGLDAAALLSHAAARGQTLVEAAKDTLAEMDQTARALLETEQMKDAMLARIAAAKRFDDIRRLGAAIAALAISP